LACIIFDENVSALGAKPHGIGGVTGKIFFGDVSLQARLSRYENHKGITHRLTIIAHTYRGVRTKQNGRKSASGIQQRASGKTPYADLRPA